VKVIVGVLVRQDVIIYVQMVACLLVKILAEILADIP